MKRSIGAKPLLCPSPVWVIGTYDAEGKPNIMTASWAGTCCSSPPCVAVSLRSATYSHACIQLNQAFTVNVLPRSMMAESDFCGIASGRDTNKWEKAGLTPVRSELVNAPYIAEAPFVAECVLKHTAELGLHTMFVGEIVDLKADAAVLNDKGKPEMKKIDPFLFSMGDMQYFAVGDVIAKAFEVGKIFCD
ncbi:MAG: flavin reductase family protein [Candidatus Auribacterota bacterium]